MHVDADDQTNDPAMPAVTPRWSAVADLHVHGVVAASGYDGLSRQWHRGLLRSSEGKEEELVQDWIIVALPVMILIVLIGVFLRRK
jgi:hypothetical protein